MRQQLRCKANLFLKKISFTIKMRRHMCKKAMQSHLAVKFDLHGGWDNSTGGQQFGTVSLSATGVRRKGARISVIESKPCH